MTAERLRVAGRSSGALYAAALQHSSASSVTTPMAASAWVTQEEVGRLRLTGTEVVRALSSGGPTFSFWRFFDEFIRWMEVRFFYSVTV